MERTQFITCPCSQQVFFCAEHCYLSSRLAPTCSSWQLCFLEKSHMELGFSSQISELKYILICPNSRFPELKIGRHSLVIMIFYVGMSDLSNVMSRSRHTLTVWIRSLHRRRSSVLWRPFLRIHRQRVGQS